MAHAVEHRNFLRVPAEFEVAFASGPSGLQRARVSDIGRRGLSVTTQAPVSPGSQVVVQFGGGQELLGRVVWVHEDLAGNRRVAGIRVYGDEESADEVVSSLLLAAVSGHSASPGAMAWRPAFAVPAQPALVSVA